MTTAKQAKETIIFTLSPVGHYEDASYTIGSRIINKRKFIVDSYDVEETNLYDFVMESAEETTSPIGVMPVVFVTENEEDETWEIREWVTGRHNSRLVDTFKTEDEAQDWLFDRTYKYDFQEDDQRDTSYYMSRDEAAFAIEERMAN